MGVQSPVTSLKRNALRILFNSRCGFSLIRLRTRRYTIGCARLNWTLKKPKLSSQDSVPEFDFGPTKKTSKDSILAQLRDLHGNNDSPSNEKPKMNFNIFGTDLHLSMLQHEIFTRVVHSRVPVCVCYQWIVKMATGNARVLSVAIFGKLL